MATKNMPVIATERPLLGEITESVGVFQTDIIFRSALTMALKDMRNNPWLLDFAFASLPRDPATSKTYGASDIERAKEWFAKVDIPVLFGVRPPDGAPPPICLSLHIMGSDETENTLADVHYEPYEELQAKWPPITKPFDVVKYDSLSGVVTLPALEVVPSVAMAIVSQDGSQYQILEVLANNEIRINRGLRIDFNRAMLRPSIPPYLASLSSVDFSENVVIGCHTSGEPAHLTWLHSIVVFALLRYRQAFFESRGFERSKISSSDFKAEDVMESPTMYFSRYVTVTGTVRTVVPVAISQRILNVETEFKISGLGKAVLELGQTLGDLMWIGDQDSLGSPTFQAPVDGGGGSEPAARGVFSGVAASIVTSADISANLSLQPSATRQVTFQVNAASGQFVWTAMPSSYGIPQFVVNGFSGGFIVSGTFTVNGESYVLYRSAHAGLGQLTVEVL